LQAAVQQSNAASVVSNRFPQPRQRKTKMDIRNSLFLDSNIRRAVLMAYLIGAPVGCSSPLAIFF
jgi:hypothetical protein